MQYDFSDDLFLTELFGKISSTKNEQLSKTTPLEFF